MEDILKFIDSEDIREYHKDSVFSPAQRAVLISLSEKTTIEEKMSALERLLKSCPIEELGAETVVNERGFHTDNQEFYEVLVSTLQEWKDVLADRLENKGVVYAVKLEEKNCPRDSVTDYRFRSTYELAYECLKVWKKEYLEDEDLREVETHGLIYRIRLDDSERLYTDGDRYFFDNEMRLVRVWGGNFRWKLEDILIGYNLYLPLPFQKGDLVKMESVFHQTEYGVFPYTRTEPKNSFCWSMYMSIDSRDMKDEADYYDDVAILSLSWDRVAEKGVKDETD